MYSASHIVNIACGCKIRAGLGVVVMLLSMIVGAVMLKLVVVMGEITNSNLSDENCVGVGVDRN